MKKKVIGIINKWMHKHFIDDLDARCSNV